MKIIGLTGGIGSGKTTVANFFKELGVPVYIADLAARKLMESSVEVRSEIIKNFGEKAYEGNFPNRKYLANIVFQNNEKLEILNSIIHPAVARNFEDWKNRQQYPYVIYEAAILFEKDNYKNCDKVIVVTAPKEIRLKRVALRDKTSFQEIEARMNKQWSDQRKIALADFVIENIDLPQVKKKVEKIHKHLLSLV